MSSGRPRHSGWPALERQSAGEQARHVLRRHRSEGDAAAGRLDLDHRLEPEQAARTGAHDLDRKSLPPGLVEHRRRDLVGADGAGGGIARHEDARGHRPTSRAISSIDCRGQPRHRLAVEQGRGRAGAEAQAIGRFDRDPAVGRRAAPVEPEAVEHLLRQRLAVHRLAGFGATKLQHVAAGRLCRESRDRRDDAVHLGAREIERFGNERHCRRRDAAEGRLNVMQDGQQRAFPSGMPADDVGALGFVPCRHLGKLALRIRYTGQSAGDRLRSTKLLGAAIEEIYQGIVFLATICVTDAGWCLSGCRARWRVKRGGVFVASFFPSALRLRP